jgi:glycolate oxidase
MVNQLEKEIRGAYPDGLTWQKTVPTFHPESAEETADIFRRAAYYGQKLFISGYGNNIDPVGEQFNDLLVIQTDRLNRIMAIDAKDFHVTVGAGYPLKEINKVIAKDKLWFGLGDTNYPGSSGGALTAGLTGSDGTHDIPVSRYLLSIKAVLPDGAIVKPGALTFKSVSGYDISRIFFNSWGTLGLVMELSFRVLPLSKKDESGHITLRPTDRQRFIDQLKGNSALSEMYRKIKAEYDPDGIFPLP